MYSSYLTVGESLHKTVVSLMSNVSSVLWPCQHVLKGRNCNQWEEASTIPVFRQIGLRYLTISIKKKNQPALTGHGFTTVMFSIKFSKLHKQGDIQLLISTVSCYSDPCYESIKSDKVAQLNRYTLGELRLTNKLVKFGILMQLYHM